MKEKGEKIRDEGEIEIKKKKKMQKCAKMK
jgi:hypothetical protein